MQPTFAQHIPGLGHEVFPRAGTVGVGQHVGEGEPVVVDEQGSAKPVEQFVGQV